MNRMKYLFVVLLSCVLQVGCSHSTPVADEIDDADDIPIDAKLVNMAISYQQIARNAHMKRRADLTKIQETFVFGKVPDSLKFWHNDLQQQATRRRMLRTLIF